MLDVVAAVIIKDGRILIAQRAEKGSLFGKLVRLKKGKLLRKAYEEK